MNVLANTIKKTMPKKKKKTHTLIPWWTRECSLKIKERNKAKNRLARCISIENLQIFQKKKAEAQRTLRQTEQKYWTDFCTKLDRYTQESKLWSCIRRMNHLPTKNKNVPLLQVHDKILTSDKEKANAFSENFFKIDREEKKKVNITDLTDSTILEGGLLQLAINDQFEMPELEKALNKYKPSAPGIDKIPYEIYNNLPKKGKELLLQLINKTWNTGDIPLASKHAILIPVLKPNKDPYSIKSYRPSALLPCFIKIIEKMVRERLQWYTEKHCVLPPFISGFRRGRSAIDNVVHVCLENKIKKTINNKGKINTIVVFLDIEQAYDTVVIEGLLSKLKTRGIRGKMFNFLQQYLTNRTYQVRINNQLSETKTLSKGLPQGSILSPLLFNIMMCDIPTNPHVDILTYMQTI